MHSPTIQKENKKRKKVTIAVFCWSSILQNTLKGLDEIGHPNPFPQAMQDRISWITEFTSLKVRIVLDIGMWDISGSVF